MYEDLSQKQIRILTFIKKQIQSKGYPPAVREICEGVHIKSTSTVHSNLLKLEKKGYIRKDPAKNRALEVIEDDSDTPFHKKDTFDVPIIGRVTAGEPILAIENIEDTFPLPMELSNQGTIFMLKVKGESMIEAGILDGDKVLVRQQNDAKNGDIVVALLDDSATVKRFYKSADRIELRPENSAMKPIIVKEVSILGKVIGLYRTIY